MRLIDADALKKDVDNFPNCYNGWSDTYDKAYIIEAIEEAPTIDAIPIRPQGEWREDRYVDSEWISPRADFFRCSICGKRVNSFQMRSYNYCPSCGARMKGADDD